MGLHEAGGSVNRVNVNGHEKLTDLLITNVRNCCLRALLSSLNSFCKSKIHLELVNSSRPNAWFCGGLLKSVGIVVRLKAV